MWPSVELQCRVRPPWDYMVSLRSLCFMQLGPFPPSEPERTRLRRALQCHAQKLGGSQLWHLPAQLAPLAPERSRPPAGQTALTAGTKARAFYSVTSVLVVSGWTHRQGATCPDGHTMAFGGCDVVDLLPIIHRPSATGAQPANAPQARKWLKRQNFATGPKRRYSTLDFFRWHSAPNFCGSWRACWARLAFNLCLSTFVDYWVGTVLVWDWRNSANANLFVFNVLGETLPAAYPAGKLFVFNGLQVSCQYKFCANYSFRGLARFLLRMGRG